MENIADLLQEKENEFLEHFMNMELGEIFEDLGIDTTSIRMNTLIALYLEIPKEFVFYLLTDTDFLNLNIISHFYEDRGIHIFGIELLNVHEPCKCCGDVSTEWIALVVDTKSDIVTLNLCRECLDSDSVQNSRYRGKPLKSILPLIDNDFSAEIIR